MRSEGLTSGPKCLASMGACSWPLKDNFRGSRYASLSAGRSQSMYGESYASCAAETGSSV